MRNYLQVYKDYYQDIPDEHLEQNEIYLKKCLVVLMKNFETYKYIMNTDQEANDLAHELIVFALDSFESYDPNKGASITTFLWTRLRAFPLTLMAKFKGIKISRYWMNKVIEENGKLEIYINSYDQQFNNWGSEE